MADAERHRRPIGLWTQIDTGLSEHPKLWRLSAALNIPEAYAQGLLVRLWGWAMHRAQDGDLSRFEPTELARACGAPGDAPMFVRALIEAGFLDATHAPDGTIVEMHLHDWLEYSGALFPAREKTRTRVSAFRAMQSAQSPTTLDSDSRNLSDPPPVTDCNGYVPVTDLLRNALQERRGEEKKQKLPRAERPRAAPVSEHQAFIAAFSAAHKARTGVAYVLTPSDPKRTQWLLARVAGATDELPGRYARAAADPFHCKNLSLSYLVSKWSLFDPVPVVPGMRLSEPDPVGRQLDELRARYAAEGG